MVRGCDGRYSGCRYKGCSTRRKGERGMRTRRTEGGRGTTMATEKHWKQEENGKRGRHRCGETERERERGIEGESRRVEARRTNVPVTNRQRWNRKRDKQKLARVGKREGEVDGGVGEGIHRRETRSSTRMRGE